MLSRTELKSNAKTSLEGKYGNAILTLLMLFGISFICGIVLAVVYNIFEIASDSAFRKILSNVADLVISGLFTFGFLSYFVKVSRNEEVDYTELFSKTKLFIPYVLSTLLIGIFTFLGFLLFIIPGIIIAISLSQVYYIILDNPEIDIMSALRKSRSMMKGHKAEYFVLQLSFLGWCILGILTCGILFLWLVPYMSVTFANFYNNLKQINE